MGRASPPARSVAARSTFLRLGSAPLRLCVRYIFSEQKLGNEEKRDFPLNLDDAIVLETFANRIEAEMAAGLLESEGIESMVAADDAGGMYPIFRLTLGVRLLVYREDEARAREILKAMEEPGEPE